VWFPNLAPSEALLKESDPAASPAGWRRFERRFRAEMKAPGAKRDLDLLAALSHATNLSLGCYCADEARCHRGVLRALLEERGASLRVEPAAGEARAGNPGDTSVK
jgi:uncharacterized protein YeaO (DUF488 family)